MHTLQCFFLAGNLEAGEVVMLDRDVNSSPPPTRCCRKRKMRLGIFSGSDKDDMIQVIDLEQEHVKNMVAPCEIVRPGRRRQSVRFCERVQRKFQIRRSTLWRAMTEKNKSMLRGLMTWSRWICQLKLWRESQ